MDAALTVATRDRIEGARPRVPWKAVALPVEHGGWSLLLEPVILGLLLQPSRAGVCLALAASGAFLARHPLRLVALDYRKRARYPRTAVALGFVLAYGAAALAFVAAAWTFAIRPFFPPLLAAAPLALLALFLDLSGRGREATAELAGSVALGASAALIVIAGGGGTEVAWMAWLLQSLRAITAILYVRERLRRERSFDRAGTPVVLIHAAALTLVVVLATFRLVPALAVVASLMLLARADSGLRSGPTGIRPQAIGLQEVAFGLASLLLLTLGFKLQL